MAFTKNQQYDISISPYMNHLLYCRDAYNQTWLCQFKFGKTDDGLWTLDFVSVSPPRVFGRWHMTHFPGIDKACSSILEKCQIITIQFVKEKEKQNG